MSGVPLLRVELRGSPVLSCLIAGVHAAAAACLLAALPPVPGILGACVMAASAVFQLRERAMLLAPRSPAVFEGWQDGTGVLTLRDGTRIPGRLSPRRYVSRWLVILSLHLPLGGRRTVVVVWDMLSTAAFRRLRLWSLWNAVPGRAGAAGA